jgi:hypothetical protein
MVVNLQIISLVGLQEKVQGCRHDVQLYLLQQLSHFPAESR